MQSVFQTNVSKADLSYIDAFCVLLPLLLVPDMMMGAPLAAGLRPSTCIASIKTLDDDLSVGKTAVLFD